MLFVAPDRCSIGDVHARVGSNSGHENLLFRAWKDAGALAFDGNVACNSCAVCQSGIDGVLCSNQHRVLFYTFGAG